MKYPQNFGLCLALCFMLVDEAGARVEPWQNSRARQWYEIGVKEKNVDQKIAALNKAVELDPLFAEAFFNLGLAYIEKQDFAHAEQYMLKAYHTESDKMNADFKVAILYELATTYNRQGKMQNYEETLRQTKNLASDSQRSATISFELGRFLYQQGRYDEALVELQEGQRLYPAKRDYFANLMQLAQTAQETQQLYAAVARAKTQGKWEEAKAALVEIKKKNPHDQNIDAQLAELEARFASETGPRNMAMLYEQAQKYEAAGELELAITSYENLLQQTGDYKDVNVRLEKLLQQLEREKLGEALEIQYVSGMEALQSHDWTTAVVTFEKILAQDGNYGDARQRLAAAQAERDRENKDTLVTRYREAAVAANTSSSRLDSLYESAVASLNNKQWAAAIALLEKLQLLQPNYRDVVDRLAEARANLNGATISAPVVESSSNSDTTFYVGGAVVALIALPALGFIVFSPQARARLFVLSGNYTAAAQIYEGLVARHPNHLKLYPRLANIYLRQGRRDQDAMKIYKMILQFNLVTPHRDEINAIVAQTFLAEERTDDEAIHVLEQALKVEHRRGRR